MPKALRYRSAYKKDLKRIARRAYDPAPLHSVVNTLAEGQALPASLRDHALKGDWQGWRECHLRPDWLLIYKITDEHVVLARTGTHADLFGN